MQIGALCPQLHRGRESWQTSIEEVDGQGTIRVFASNELESNSVRFGSRFGGGQVSFERQRTKLSSGHSWDRFPYRTLLQAKKRQIIIKTNKFSNRNKRGKLKCKNK